MLPGAPNRRQTIYIHIDMREEEQGGTSGGMGEEDHSNANRRSKKNESHKRLVNEAKKSYTISERQKQDRK